jgi:hypothetical protein
MADLIPILGILCGIIIPLAAFYWQYLEGREKRELVIEIAKHNDDPIKIAELMALLEEPTQEPVDYRRGGSSPCALVLASISLERRHLGTFLSE